MLLSTESINVSLEKNDGYGKWQKYKTLMQKHGTTSSPPNAINSGIQMPSHNNLWYPCLPNPG